MTDRNVYVLWLKTEKALSAYQDFKKLKLKGRERLVARMMEGRAYSERETGEEGVLPYSIELSFNRHIASLLLQNVRKAYEAAGCVEGYDYEVIEVKERDGL